MPTLELRDIRCSWSPQWWSDPSELIEGASVILEPGQWCALIGDNGIGKSTMLHGVAGSCPFVRGTIRVHGTALEPGIVAQRFVVGLQLVPQEVLCRAQWRWSDVMTMAFQKRRGLCLQKAADDLHRSAIRAGLLRNSETLLTPRVARLFVALLSCPSVLLLDEVAPIFPNLLAADLYNFIKLAAPKAAVIFVDHSLSAALEAAHVALMFDSKDEADGRCTLCFRTVPSNSVNSQKLASANSDPTVEVDVAWHLLLPLLNVEHSAKEHVHLAFRASILPADITTRLYEQIVRWWPYVNSPRHIEFFSGGMKVVLHSIIELFTAGWVNLDHSRCRHLHMWNRDRLAELNSLAATQV